MKADQNTANHLVEALLQDSEIDPKEFVEKAWTLDVNDLKAALAAENLRTLGIHVLRNRSHSLREEDVDHVHVHVYVNGDPKHMLPIDQQIRIKDIVRDWAASGHAPVVDQTWIPMVITRAAHMYHLDTFIVVDPDVKIVNFDV
jgi:hypothetical protein